MFNAKTGRYDGVSTAYRMKLAQAFVVDPDKPMDIPVIVGDMRRRKAYDYTTAAMIKATANPARARAIAHHQPTMKSLRLIVKPRRNLPKG